MNKIVNVDNTELEALKQMAMEIALRLNVIQGESLLSDTTEVRQVSPTKKAASEDEILIGKIIMIGSFFVGVAIFAACGAGSNSFLGGIAGLMVGLGLYSVHHKNKNKQRKEAAK